MLKASQKGGIVMQQLPMFDLGTVNSHVDTRKSIDEQFAEFHANNPNVYRAIRTLALDMKQRGRDHYGIKSLFEIVRWSHVRTTGDSFKLNNNYTSRYARLLMEREPELAGFFETRELKTARVAKHSETN